MQTVFDNIIYIQNSKYSAKVGTGVGMHNTGIENPNLVGDKLIINDTIVIKGRRLTVKVLNDYCFGNLTKLKEAVIPNTITEIKQGTFWYCLMLEKVTFMPGSRVQSLDFRFLDTTNVPKLVLPATIKHIGDGFIYNINVDIEITYCGTTVFSNNLFQHMHTNAKVFVHSGYKSDKFGSVNVVVNNDIICPSVVYQDKYTKKCTFTRKHQSLRNLFILIFVVVK